MPIIDDAALLDEVVALGEELLWLHTEGERFADGDDLAASRAVGITHGQRRLPR